jgi:ribosomal protein L21E
MSKVLRPVAYLALFAIVFTLFGFRLAHPQSGLRSAAGEANTSIVVYRNADEYKVGDKVVIRLEPEAQSPAIGIVRTSDATTVVAQVGDVAVPTQSKEVLGKLIGVFPFIGVLFNLIGQ